MCKTKLNYLTGKGKSSSHFWHCQKNKLDLLELFNLRINNLGDIYGGTKKNCTEIQLLPT